MKHEAWSGERGGNIQYRTRNGEFRSGDLADLGVAEAGKCFRIGPISSRPGSGPGPGRTVGKRLI